MTQLFNLRQEWVQVMVIKKDISNELMDELGLSIGGMDILGLQSPSLRCWLLHLSYSGRIVSI